jgi:uncharacterized protein
MKIDDGIISKIESEAKARFQDLGPSHDWSHVGRVLQTALAMAEKEKADLEIVKIATYLHDIGRKSLKEEDYYHAVEGAKMAREILKNYALSLEQVDNICHCIETHRFRSENIPQTIEAKCVHDADKLDVLGALGIARSYIYLGETMDCVIYLEAEENQASNNRRTNSVQEEYEIKYRHLPEKMLTKTGKSMASERLNYMKSFLDRLENEVQGKL